MKDWEVTVTQDFVEKIGIQSSQTGWYTHNAEKDFIFYFLHENCYAHCSLLLLQYREQAPSKSVKAGRRMQGKAFEQEPVSEKTQQTQQAVSALKGSWFGSWLYCFGAFRFSCCF